MRITEDSNTGRGSVRISSASAEATSIGASPRSNAYSAASCAACVCGGGERCANGFNSQAGSR